jgi:tetratricopeptide (TPR) repeat protein
MITISRKAANGSRNFDLPKQDVVAPLCAITFVLSRKQHFGVQSEFPQKECRSMRLSDVCLLTAVWAVVLSSSASGQSAKTNLNDPERQQAMQFYQQHKLPEAAALLEKVVARYPEDVVAHEAYGSSLLSRAATWNDPAKRKADRLHARRELLRAKELGDNSDLCKTLLAGIPEDGSESAFSQNQEVEAAMQRGEAAFARGEFEDAIAGYQRALALDPKLYYAAVDIGDSYFRLKNGDEASKWFGKAVEIDPGAEVAYRYWGDSLLQEGKMQEARDKFIDGLLAEPYRQTSWGGLHNWLNANHLSFKKIAEVKLPQAPTVDGKGNTTITVDPSTLDNSDRGAAWLVYGTERALWRKEKFAKEFPKAKTYRHSLPEEISALTMVATVFEELQQKNKSSDPDPSLALLAELKAKGMLEPYILFFHPDEGIMQDYPAYKVGNRAKLVRFLDEYVLPPTP